MATNDNPPIVESAAPLTERYANVDQMMREDGSPEDLIRRVTEASDSTRVTRVLAGLRAAHGLTQKEMGQRIGVTQGAISKLEAGRDEELRLSEILAYARALNERIGVVYGPQPSHVEAINTYLGAAKIHMLELAKVAQKDAEMDSRMNKFFGETFQNVMEMLAEIYTNLPNGIKGCEFTKEVIHCPSVISHVSRPSLSAPQRELAHV